jgi:hypothetical protein
LIEPARARAAVREDDAGLAAGRLEDERHDVIRTVRREPGRRGIAASRVDCQLDEIAGRAKGVGRAERPAERLRGARDQVAGGVRLLAHERSNDQAECEEEDE